MTEHIREEYALRRPDGTIAGPPGRLPVGEQESLNRCRNARDLFGTDHVVVHRTVTFTDWEEVQ